MKAGARYLAAVLLTTVFSRCALEAPEQGTVNLLAAAYAPVLLRETGELLPGDPAFLSGLHREFVAPKGDVRAWADEGPIRVKLGFTTMRARTLEVEASGFWWEGAPPLFVDALLDGVPIGSFECSPSWQTYSLPLPEPGTTPGEHVVELFPSRAAIACDVKPGTVDPRMLSLVLRAVRVTPVLPGSARAEYRPGRLVLPPGTAASWTDCFPGASRLQAMIDLPGDAFDNLEFFVVEDNGALSILKREDRRLGADSPVRLAVARPHGSQGAVTVRGLEVRPDPGSREMRGRPKPAAPAKVAIVVGSLDSGFPVVPCSTDPHQALQCLLTGSQASALGRRFPAVLDFVGNSADQVAAFLASKPAPLVAALVAPDEPAHINAMLLRDAAPEVKQILTALPSGRESFQVFARMPGAEVRPVNATHLDLVATAFGLAGSPQPLDPSSVDLSRILDRGDPERVRPAAWILDKDRSIAMVEARPFVVWVGVPREPQTILDAYLIRLLERTRRQVQWLAY